MRELELRVERPQIRINGHVFDLQLSDMEIYIRAQALLERYAHFADSPRTTGEALAAAQELTGFLEELLGPGALRIISDGKPVSLRLTAEWLGAIAREAAGHYADAVMEEDEGHV